MLTPPKGFEDVEVRRRAAAMVGRLIEAWRVDPDRVTKFGRYKIAQDVIDNKTTVSALTFVNEIEPFQPDLIAQRVEGVVADVAGGYSGPGRFMLTKGSEDDELRESVEADMQVALEADYFAIKVQDICNAASVWCRGPYRTTYVTKYYGSRYLGADNAKEIEFSGPTDEPIPPQDFIAWPTDVPSLDQTMIHGHRFKQARWEMLDLQAAKDGYFDDIEIPQGHYTQKATGDADDHGSENSETDRPEAYHVIVMLRPGDFVDKDAEGWEEAKEHPMRAYRMWLLGDSYECLALEEYPYPESEYFIPAMTRNIGEIYATDSIASKGLAQQIIYNDSITASILSQVAAVKRPVFASGFVSDMDTIPISIGDLYGFKGNPQFFSPPIPGNSGQAMESLADRMERVVDGAMGQSQVGTGQLPDTKQTATATAGALQGQNKRSAKLADTFNPEIERSVRFKALLIHRNWSDFKKFHKDKLKTKSAADWKGRWEFAANGHGPNNNPELTLKKIEAVTAAAQNLGIEYFEDVDPTQPKLAISRNELFRDIVDNVDLPSGTENLIHEIEPTPEPPPEVPDPADVGLGGGPIPGLPGAGGPGDAELLAALAAGGGAPGIPGGVPLPDAAPAPIPLDLLLGAGAGPGVDPTGGGMPIY